MIQLNDSWILLLPGILLILFFSSLVLLSLFNRTNQTEEILKAENEELKKDVAFLYDLLKKGDTGKTIKNPTTKEELKVAYRRQVLGYIQLLQQKDEEIDKLKNGRAVL